MVYARSGRVVTIAYNRLPTADAEDIPLIFSLFVSHEGESLSVVHIDIMSGMCVGFAILHVADS